MVMFNEIADKLNKLDIQIQTVEHEPAITIELADKFIEGIEGIRTKTMLLTNKKKNKFYLIIMDDKKRLDMNRFKEIVEEKQIKMAPEELLFEKMMLQRGVVSPFGLLNNKDKDIQIYFDKEIVNEDRMSFHPNTNEKTIFIHSNDLFKFLEEMGFLANVIEL